MIIKASIWDFVDFLFAKCGDRIKIGNVIFEKANDGITEYMPGSMYLWKSKEIKTDLAHLIFPLQEEFLVFLEKRCQEGKSHHRLVFEIGV